MVTLFGQEKIWEILGYNAAQKLAEKFSLAPQVAREKVELYWR